ncbi:MAG: hypothetical protein J3Q66DRAFT_382825 [Benniella sp.]|nr:MAG: hypothetical protein J3Q66DRAFT_382825 [Benniella sp.]
MSGTTRQAARILSPVQHLYHLRCRSIHSTLLRPVRHSISLQLQQLQRQQTGHRFLTTNTRPVSASQTNTNTTPSSSSDPDEKPPTTIQTSQITPETLHLDATMKEDAKSIEQIIAELNQDTRTGQHSTFPGDTGDPSSSSHSDSTASEDTTTETIAAAAAASARVRAQQRRSRFLYILYAILYYSALGSIPVNLLLIKGEAKELNEKQEWKIGVLTEMRDKLRRGESVAEEEALLSVGLNRSKREEQVDDKYFEDLLVTAEKLDFAFGKDRDTLTTGLDTTAAAGSTPSPVTTAPASPPPPPPPATPRKPPPPKTEKSFL